MENGSREYIEYLCNLDRTTDDGISDSVITYFLKHKKESYILSKNGMSNWSNKRIMKEWLDPGLEDMYGVLNYLKLHFEFYLTDLIGQDETMKILDTTYLTSNEKFDVCHCVLINVLTLIGMLHPNDETKTLCIRDTENDIEYHKYELTFGMSVLLFYGIMFKAMKLKHNDLDISLEDMLKLSYLLCPLTNKDPDHVLDVFLALKHDDILFTKGVELKDDIFKHQMVNLATTVYHTELFHHTTYQRENVNIKDVCNIPYFSINLLGKIKSESTLTLEMLSSPFTDLWPSIPQSPIHSYAPNNIADYHNVNPEPYEMLYRILTEHQDDFHNILYMSDITAVEMASLMSLEGSMKKVHDVYSLVLVFNLETNDPIETLQKLLFIGNLTYGLARNTLVIINGHEKVYTSFVSNVVKHHPLTSKLRILHITGYGYKDGHKIRDINHDILLNDMFIELKAGHFNSDKDGLYFTSTKRLLCDNVRKLRSWYPDLDLYVDNLNLAAPYRGAKFSNFDKSDKDADKLGHKGLELDKLYNIKYLKIQDNDVNDIVNRVKQYYNNYPNEPLSMIFEGESGQGKSALASYIAKETNKKLITTSGSTFISKWVGKTEKNIKNIFKDIKDDSILLIEEADNLFLNREDEHKSYDISMVNEFLIQLDRFKGTLIITTNRMKYLDKAFLRRFTLKLTFLDIDKELILDLLKDVKKEYKLKGNLPKELNLKNIRLGDIGNVNKIIKFNNITTVDEYLDQLNKEVEHRKKMNGKEIGFM